MPSPNNDTNANDASSSRCLTAAINNSSPSISTLAPSSINLYDNENDVDSRQITAPTIENTSSSDGIDGVEQIMSECAPEPPFAMTAAAAIVVAKQRRGAPGVEQHGTHDDAGPPMPFCAEETDDDDAGKKSLGNTSKNNHVEHDAEDNSGALPFKSDEFEDGMVGKKMAAGRELDGPRTIDDGEEGGGDTNLPAILPVDVDSIRDIEEEQEQENHNQDDYVNADVELNARRPQYETATLPTTLPPPRSMLPNDDEESMIHLEATLVPNEPVYDGVPVEPVPAWYKQAKARPFFAFICILIIAGAIAIGLLSSSFNPDESSFNPGDDSSDDESPPSTTVMLSNSTSLSPSSTPTNKCFANKRLLREAITLYEQQLCRHSDIDCDIGRHYGYPMNTWCVGEITDMSQLFRNRHYFNEDISNWQVSSVTDMFGMFANARPFNSNLSRWDVSSVTDMRDMFSYAQVFNSDLSGWNVSSVTNARQMFHYASAFNQDLCAWGDIFQANKTKRMFYDSGCTFKYAPNERPTGSFCASSCSTEP